MNCVTMSFSVLECMHFYDKIMVVFNAMPPKGQKIWLHAGNHVESNRNKGFSEIHWINTLCDGHAHEIFFYLYTFANIDWWLVDINGLDIFWLHGGDWQTR